MNYCPGCGTANRDGSRFCNECGHKLPSKTGIICPMCSHVNPAQNVYCDQCQARLVPLATGSKPGQPSAPPSAPSASPPSLKKGLSLPTKRADEPEPTAAPEPDDVPEWLLKLRAAAPKASELKDEGAGTPTAGYAPGEPSSTGEMPDWMRPASGEEPDWFMRITESSQDVMAAETPSSPTLDDLPDWMRELEAASGSAQPPSRSPAAEPPEEEPVESAEAEVPDWLGGTVGAAATTPGDLPAWLADLASAAPTQVEPVAAQPPSQVGPVDLSLSEDEAPDWLQDLESAAPPVAEPASGLEAVADTELPDWLAGLSAGEPEAQPESGPATPEPAAKTQEEPDWLAALRDSAPAIEPVTDEATTTPQVGTPETPDWLSGLQAEPTSEAPGLEPDWLAAIREAGQPASVEMPASDEPDWLGALRAQPDESQAEQATDLPDWLAGVGVPGAQAPSPSEVEPAVDSAAPRWLEEAAQAPADAEPSTAAPADVPDWLREMRPGGEIGFEEQPSVPAAPASTFVSSDEEIAPPAELPTWLADITESPVPAPATPDLAQPAEVPDWLRKLGPLPTGPSQPEQGPFGEALPIEPDQLPAWLRQIRPGEQAPAFADEAGQPVAAFEASTVESAGLTAATIPSWLEALRPKETVAAPVEMEVVEETGLLAGLRNVIPASPLMAMVQGPSSAAHVEVSAADIARAGLFQELLARGSLAPTVMQSAAGRQGKLTDRLTRWIVALLLIAAAFVPSFSNVVNNLFSLRTIANPAALYGDAKSRIDGMTSGARVLVVFDYDPAQAREMEPIAVAILTHLQQKDARIAVATLNPLGVSLAESAAGKARAAGQADISFVSSAYYPGQSVGARQALDDSRAESVVVLAGSPETLRWWVEQNAALDAQKPIMAGLSAGALPQSQPYVQSGQVAAVIAGQMGGLAYQRVLDSEPDREDADGLDRVVRSESLYLAQLIFALILAAGVLVALFSRTARRTS